MRALRLLAATSLAACSVGAIDAGEAGEAPEPAPGVDAAPPADGAPRLTITATSSPTPGGGPYAPRNVVAVWVEAQGAFVKTIDRRAGARRQHLVAWTAVAGGNDVDAVTGATRNNHVAPLAISWDLVGRDGAVIPDGTYTIRMESTDLNANQAAQNNQGTFTFTKSSEPERQADLTSGGFSAVTIDVVP
jgi:hypothetical protein